MQLHSQSISKDRVKQIWLSRWESILYWFWMSKESNLKGGLQFFSTFINHSLNLTCHEECKKIDKKQILRSISTTLWKCDYVSILNVKFLLFIKWIKSVSKPHFIFFLLRANVFLIFNCLSLTCIFVRNEKGQLSILKNNTCYLFYWNASSIFFFYNTGFIFIGKGWGIFPLSIFSFFLCIPFSHSTRDCFSSSLSRE